jgi:hypothetical protein
MISVFHSYVELQRNKEKLEAIAFLLPEGAGA